MESMRSSLGPVDNVFVQRPETYLGESKATPTKDNFAFLAEKIAAGPVFRPKRFLDIGCATGDLIAFAARRFPGLSAVGVDVDPLLINHARQRKDVGESEFELADGLTYRGEGADIVCCFGMLGIFDRFEPLLENLIANTFPGGVVFVFGLMNPDDIDVNIRYRDNGNNLDWMRGFNIFSRAGIARWLEGKSLEPIFHDFRMRSELAKRPHLPHRAHTITLTDGERRMINGLCLLLPETLLEIRVP